jgi:hypothetical protein
MCELSHVFCSENLILDCTSAWITTFYIVLPLDATLAIAKERTIHSDLKRVTYSEDTLDS